MILEETETYSDRRLRFTVTWLAILILILVLIGLLSHPAIHNDKPVWKSSPYGELHDTAGVKADSNSRK